MPLGSPECPNEPPGLRDAPAYRAIKSNLAQFTKQSKRYPLPGDRYVLPEQMNRFKKHHGNARGRACVDLIRRAYVEPLYCAQVLNSLDLPQWVVEVVRVIWCEYPQRMRDSGLEEWRELAPGEGVPPGALDLNFPPLDTEPPASDPRAFRANAEPLQKPAQPKSALPSGEQRGGAASLSGTATPAATPQPAGPRGGSASQRSGRSRPPRPPAGSTRPGTGGELRRAWPGEEEEP